MSGSASERNFKSKKHTRFTNFWCGWRFGNSHQTYHQHRRISESPHQGHAAIIGAADGAINSSREMPMEAQRRYPRRWAWPNGAKIAMSVNLAFEAFIDHSQFSSSNKPGRPDPFSLSFG